jgi:cytochrome oxidase assembly protein ShyY1
MEKEYRKMTSKESRELNRDLLKLLGLIFATLLVLHLLGMWIFKQI